jgi:hypothetical protein
LLHQTAALLRQQSALIADQLAPAGLALLRFAQKLAQLASPKGTPSTTMLKAASFAKNNSPNQQMFLQLQLPEGVRRAGLLSMLTVVPLTTC